MDDRVARLLREVQLSPPLRFIDDIAILKGLVAELALAVGDTDEREPQAGALPGGAD